jgi:hypothetical protein
VRSRTFEVEQLKQEFIGRMNELIHWTQRAAQGATRSRYEDRIKFADDRNTKSKNHRQKSRNSMTRKMCLHIEENTLYEGICGSAITQNRWCLLVAEQENETDNEKQQFREAKFQTGMVTYGEIQFKPDANLDDWN